MFQIFRRILSSKQRSFFVDRAYQARTVRQLICSSCCMVFPTEHFPQPTLHLSSCKRSQRYATFLRSSRTFKMTGNSKDLSEDENLEQKVVQAAKDKFDIKPDDLKDFQKDSIISICKGNDVSIVQPPGGGKSICFAIPTLILNKRTVVVQPVAPLMFDQKHKLEKKGIKVEIIDKTVLDKSKEQQLDEQIQNADIIFVSPDAVFDDKGKETVVLKCLQKMEKEDGFALIALDEAHLCWHAFLPQYRQLVKLTELFPKTALMALTGTATKENRKRLLTEFLRKDRSKEFWASMDTPHIQISCRQVEASETSSSDKKNDHPEKSDTSVEHWKDVVELISEDTKDEPAVVFFDNQEACETLEKAFKKYAAKMKILTYTGDNSVDEQAKILRSWVDGKASLIIATTAFGHGVDRPDVRHVYRLGVPQSLEEWVQEAGRAGRDSKPAKATLLWHELDPSKMEFKGLTKEEKAEAVKRVERVLHFCRCDKCRRVELLDYFGEKLKDAKCGNCDACLGKSGQADIQIKEHKHEAKLDL